MLLAGCGNGSRSSGESPTESIGQLALPLVTHGASGTLYRLRDATFAIHHYGYAGYGGGSVGGGGGSDQVITVSSETDPDSETISVSVEEGQYYVELLPGWHFERETPGGAVTVEATLLYGETQWVYVSRRSTSFAEFQFGLGDREVWLNGDLNIGVVLYEDPSELGYGGSGGVAGAAGAFPGGSGGFVSGGTGSGGAAPSP